MVWFWKLFWPIVGKNCLGDQEKHLKIEADKQKYVKSMRSLEQFIETVKGQTILETEYFLTWGTWGFSVLTNWKNQKADWNK